MNEWKVFRTLTRKTKWETILAPTQEEILNKPPLFHINRLKFIAAKIEFCQNKIKFYSQPLDFSAQNAITNLCQNILTLYPDIFE